MSISFMHPCTQSEIAEKLHVSPRQLDRIARKHLGQSFHQAIMARRITAAEKMLLTTDMTAEKICFSKFLANEFNTEESALIKGFFGTHTHVQTADERILNGKTAYISDVGMTGPYNSILGVRTEISVKNFVNGTKEKYKVADGNCRLDGIVISAEFDRKPPKITRFSIV